MVLCVRLCRPWQVLLLFVLFSPFKRVSGASVRSQFAFLISVLIYCLSGQQAVAAKRVALVIGNSAYQNVAQLPNPLKDAAAIADMFKKAGFDVVESRQNLKNVETRRTLNSFFDSVRDAEIAVVYYGSWHRNRGNELHRSGRCCA